MMKTKILLIAFCLLPFQLFAQVNNNWQLIVLGGIFSPVDDEVQNVYGDGPIGKLYLATPLGKMTRLKFGLDLSRRNGDPFYKSPDFDAGNAANLGLTGFSLTLENNPKVHKLPLLRLGAGIEYVFGTETITGQASSTGQSIGGHISLTPELPISNRVSFFAEVGYRFLELTFKHDRDRFKVNLSGPNLLIGLGYDFHK